MRLIFTGKIHAMSEITLSLNTSCLQGDNQESKVNEWGKITGKNRD